MFFSYSKISKFENCQHDYVESYIKRNRGDGNIFTWLGNAVHEVLENGYQKVDEDKYKLFGIDYLRYLLEQNKFYDKLNGDYKKTAKDIIYNYYQKHKNKKLNGLKRELSVKQEITSYATLVGNIDKIYEKGDTIYVVDYKTSSSTKYTGEPKNNLQMKIYDLFASTLYPDKKIKVVLDFIKIDERLEYEFSDEDRENNKKEIIKKIDKIIEFEMKYKNGEIIPNKNKQFTCQYCGRCDTVYNK